MNLFTERVIHIIHSIPSGHVMSYGQVAAAAEVHARRQVVRILHSMSKKHGLPWHRIINAQGAISYTAEDQRKLLEAEGIVFSLKGKVDLTMYRWFPPDAEEG